MFFFAASSCCNVSVAKAWALDSETLQSSSRFFISFIFESVSAMFSFKVCISASADSACLVFIASDSVVVISLTFSWSISINAAANAAESSSCSSCEEIVTM
ncbi:hypothetical protein Hanom_Chr13g01235571 [Helianthus anomalus]